MRMLLAVVVGYLLGSLPSADLVAARRGKNIRHLGSGNPGAANVMRELGRRAGLAVMGLDLGKGWVAAGLGETIGDQALAGYWGGAAAVVGHCFPAWSRFKGGKGVATTVGMLAWVLPWVALVTALVWIALTKLSGISSVGSVVAIAVAVPLGWWQEVRGWAFGIVIGVAALVLLKHRANLAALRAGRERRLDR